MLVCVQVNVPRLANAMLPSNRPWVKLAMGLSRILCGSAPTTPPAEITLTLCGANMKTLGMLCVEWNLRKKDRSLLRGCPLLRG